MRALSAAALLAIATATAHANGRPPATSSIQFQVGHDSDVLLGVTFGVVLSHDGGATWQWMCESSVGYGGTFDPQYLWFASGAMFATTTNGLHVGRDGCTFAQTTALGADYISAIARGPDNALYAAASDPTDATIYKSTDEGVTFPQTAAPGALGTQWQSLATAPSDATRVYLSGWAMPSGGPRSFLLFRSVTGAQAFTALPTTSFTPISDASTLDVVAVSPTDADLVFVRVTSESGTVGDAIYRSADGAQTFTKVLEVADAITGLVVRPTGDVIAATPTLGIYRSIDGGATFQPVATAPVLHPHCLAQNSAGALWACAENYANEMMGAATSSDGASWTSALRYQDIAAPIACGAGTTQHDTCQAILWCGLRAQLGISADPTQCPIPDGPSTHGGSKGCCDAGSDGSAVAMCALVAAIVRRRRVSTGCRT